MKYFNIDLSTLKDGETKATKEEIDGAAYMVFRSRNGGSATFLLGCSSISELIDIRSDGYWFAALFPLPKPISKLDPAKMFQCIVGLLPHLEKWKITLPDVTLNCFQEEEDGEYKLAIANCKLQFDATEEEFRHFQMGLVGLLSGNARLRMPY